MTTNHRPTLESKRGRANPIKNTIKHARALSGQMGLKLRPDIEGAKVSTSLGKRALEDPESSTKRQKGELENLEPSERHNSDSLSLESGSVTDDEREEDENVESREVIEKVKEDEDKKNHKGLQNKLELPRKSSWRNTPFRNKVEPRKESLPTYTTDTLHSDKHQKFLNKYIH